MANKREIDKLIKYAKSLKIIAPDYPYRNMAATISEAILQAGINYDKVVLPRIKVILSRYKSLNKTSAFLHAIKNKGLLQSEWVNLSHFRSPGAYR